MPPTLIDLKARLREMFKRFEQRELLAEREELLLENARLCNELDELRIAVKKRRRKNELPWLTPDQIDRGRDNYIVCQKDGEVFLRLECDATADSLQTFLRLP